MLNGAQVSNVARGQTRKSTHACLPTAMTAEHGYVQQLAKHKRAASKERKGTNSLTGTSKW